MNMPLSSVARRKVLIFSCLLLKYLEVCLSCEISFSIFLFFKTNSLFLVKIFLNLNSLQEK